MWIKQVSIDWFEASKLGCVVLPEGGSVDNVASGGISLEVITYLEEKNKKTAVDIYKRKMKKALLQELIYGNIWQDTV